MIQKSSRRHGDGLKVVQGLGCKLNPFPLFLMPRSGGAITLREARGVSLRDGTATRSPEAMGQSGRAKRACIPHAVHAARARGGWGVTHEVRGRVSAGEASPAGLVFPSALWVTTLRDGQRGSGRLPTSTIDAHITGV